MSDFKHLVTSTPHIRSEDTIQKIMLEVIIALVPAGLAAAYFFGLRAITVILISVISCVLFEKLYQKIVKQPDTTYDLSAVVTGVLLAYNLPASVPFWVPIIGSLFAIMLVKMLFGGLGQNFMNPALSARAFLQNAFPKEMVAWTEPVRSLGFVDTVSTATPLNALKLNPDFVPKSTDYMNALIGNIGGCLGETCAILLLLGGIYLIVRKIISWRTPVSYIATFMVLVLIFGRDGLFTGFAFYEVLVGGIMLGAFFMATDYSSSPITPKGQIIMGLGCGILTFVIRVFGGYPEGVCYSILLMNLAVPLIDRFTKPRVYGVKKEAKSRG